MVLIENVFQDLEIILLRGLDNSESFNNNNVTWNVIENCNDLLKVKTSDSSTENFCVSDFGLRGQILRKGLRNGRRV